MVNNDKMVSIKMPKELVSRVTSLAKENSVSFSAQVRLILLDYLKRINNGQKDL